MKYLSKSIILLALSSSLYSAVAQEPTADPPGTILIEDNDASAVETTIEAKSSTPHPTLTASGGTIMGFAEAKKEGDGSSKVTVSPTPARPVS